MCFRPTAIAMKKCTECGQANIEKATVCKKCGAELPDVIDVAEDAFAENKNNIAPPKAPSTPAALGAPKTPGVPKEPGAPKVPSDPS